MNKLQFSLLGHSSLRFYAHLFALRKIPEPSNSMDIIVECAIERAKRQSNPLHSSLRGRALLKAVQLCKLRANHFPIQYLMGEWPFRYLNLNVRPPVLIPRFETENLVSIVVAQIRKKWKRGEKIQFVDFGCGSGAIGLSLFKELHEDYELQSIFVDISPLCLTLTEQNAKKNNLSTDKMQFLQGDMLSLLKLIDQCQVVVSNPPYLQQRHYAHLQKQVKLYEAKTALVGGKTGLSLVVPLATAILDVQKRGSNLMGAIEYGGQGLHEWGWEQHVVIDQYGKRRYLVFP